ETLRPTQACLDITAGPQNLGPTQPMPAPASSPMVLAKPQPFDGTCGSAAKAFVGQVGLHAVTYPERLPTNTSKVAFAILFMKDYTATWSQPYLDKVFNRKPVVALRNLPRLELCRPTHRNSTSKLWKDKLTQRVTESPSPMWSLYRQGGSCGSAVAAADDMVHAES
ncbi:uncharacterized protein VP01_9173g1, partial [Puccinia sorghi]